MIQKIFIKSFLLPLAIAVSLLENWTNKSALAQVTPANDGTGTSVKTNGNQFNIQGGTLSGNGTNLFHSLEKFGLSRDQIATFLSNPQIRNILTRVVGGDASIINGLIQVTGGNANLFLMNPAGIIFGPNAMINLRGDFVVTTATGIGFGNNQWFNAVGSNDYKTLIGNPSQFVFDLANPGVILNAGNLSVAEGQNLSLIGGTVINTGTISAPGGDITIAAVPGTSKVKISKAGNLVSLEVELLPQTGQALNINPLDLPTLLTEGAKGLALNLPTNAAIKPATAIASGTINTEGTKGGQVAILGQQVGVINGNINASGTNGGGIVRIGGDYQGKGTIPNAKTTVVNESSRISADALSKGDGGKVIIWGDKLTEFNGIITAKGGLLSGNGGFVETSGKEQLIVGNTAQIITSAPQGITGTWLLDPINLTVVASDGTGTIDGSGNNSPSDNSINSSTIEIALSSTNVNLTADNFITVNAAIDTSSNLNPSNLTLSTQTINLNAPISLAASSILAGTANIVNVSSTGSIQNSIDVAAVGGNVNLASATYALSQGLTIAKSLTLNGEGFSNTTVSGNNAFRPFTINGTTLTPITVNLNNLRITEGNSNESNGGGIFIGNAEVNLNNSLVNNNNATFANGGGIYNEGTLNINNSTIDNNTTAFGDGGGLYNAGIATINNSAITNNTVNGNGGGIYNNSNSITITNTTISQNTVNNTPSTSGAVQGGGLYNSQAGIATIQNSTIGLNSVTASFVTPNGGGIANNGVLNLSNTIVAGNTAATAPDISGNIASQGYNLVQNQAGSLGYIGTDLPNGTDPLLGPLQNNAGTTQTQALQVNSPAIDAGDPSSILNTDQRGAQRGQSGGLNAGSRIDIGAYEATSSYLVTTTTDSIAPDLGSLRAALNFTNSGLNVNNNAANLINPATDTINFDQAEIFAAPQAIPLSNGELTLTRSTNINGTGNTNLTISGNNLFRVFNISGVGTTVNLNGLTIAQGNANNGGGIQVGTGSSLIFSNSILSDNLATALGGAIYNTGNLTFNNLTLLNNTAADGSGIYSNNNNAIAFQGITTLGSNVTSLGSQTYENNVTLLNNITLTGSDISFQNTVDGSQDLVINADGITQFNGLVGDINPLNSITTNTAGITQFNGNITTTGIQNYQDDVEINNSINLNTSNSNINFGNSLDSQLGESNNLTLTTGIGNITFTDSVGNNQTLGAIQINNGGTTRFNNLVNATSLTTDIEGITEINGNINTTNFQTYNDALNIANNPILTNTGNTIQFNNTVDNNPSNLTNSNLSINSGNTIFFNATLGSISAINNLDLNSENITLSNNVNTLNNQVYNGSVLLAQNLELNSINNGNIQFANTVDGNFALTVNSGSISLLGNMGSVLPLTTLNLNSSQTNLNANITTSSNQNYSGLITLTNNPTLISTSGDISFSRNIIGNTSLILQANNNITTANIDTSSTTSTGGDISLTVTNGSVTTRNLNSSGQTQGGDIFINAQKTITTGIINTSGNQAENVMLDPEGDVQVGYINTQSADGIGGIVDITTASFFQATDTFIDRNGTIASISSAGSEGGGSITIRHGGNGITPFVVGNSAVNGTTGAITSGEFILNPLADYFFTTIVGNISLITGGTPPTPIPTPTPVPTPTPIPIPVPTPNPTPISGVPILNTPNQLLREAPQAKLEARVPSSEVLLNRAVKDLDERFAQDYTSYLGLAQPSEQSIKLELAEAPALLREIQQATGVKSALVYVYFLPANGVEWELQDQNNPLVNAKPDPKITDELGLIVVTGQGILPPVRLKGITRKDVLNTTRQFERNLVSVASAEQFLPQAKDLYQWLVAPIEESLKTQGVTNLTFVLDKGLRSLPLAALYDANSQQYIIEKYSVSLIPSLSLTNTTRQDLREAQVLGMGADTFSDQNSLPAVPIELTQIAEKLWKGKIFLNQNFTVENFKRALNSNQFSLVHLATHGEFLPGDRNKSFIVFSDQKLTLDEFANLGLDRPIDLLTLSACRTAVGDLDAELGFAGLAVKTGVRTALGSLWYVSDQGTLALMSSFYSQLKTSPTKSESLRRAQLSLLRNQVKIENQQMIIDNDLTISLESLSPESRKLFGNKDLSHPYYWSSFTIIGNPW